MLAISFFICLTHTLIIKKYVSSVVYPGVNFINVLRARFSYECYVLAAFLVTFWLWCQNFVRNKHAKMLMKLTPGCFCPICYVICPKCLKRYNQLSARLLLLATNIINEISYNTESQLTLTY
jgi:hypothetical protein